MSVSSHHNDWFNNYVTLAAFAQLAPLKIKKKLEFAILQTHSKVSPLYEKAAKYFGLQSSPFLPQICRYHRSTPNSLLDKVQAAFARKLGLEAKNFAIIESPLIRENLEREFPQAEHLTQIHGDDDLIALINKLIKYRGDSYSHSSPIFDVSEYANKHGIAPKDFQSNIVDHFTTIIENCIRENVRENHASCIKNMNDFRDSIGITFYAIIEHDGYQILVSSDSQKFLSAANDIMARAGFRITPDQAKKAWVDISDLESILIEAEIPKTEMKGLSADICCRSLLEMLDRPESALFHALTNEIDPPYLRIHPSAILKLLAGFFVLEIDSKFQKRGLSQLLQISYSKILHAMKLASENKENMVIFANQIELIHQEMQTWLVIIDPYKKGDELEKAILENLKGIFPSDSRAARVYLKSSAMRCFSSILAGVEKQKGQNKLNICIHKDSYYYETDQTLKQLASNYNVTVFNTDCFPISSIENCFSTSSPSPFDLLILEYNHNISSGRYFYRKENILGQIKAIAEKGMLSEQCTILIDTTILLERSDDLKLLFADAEIKSLISAGKLNIVLSRSTQKFDMLGIDNYYGGIAITINEAVAFKTFNIRMQHPLDQLKGLNYQGLTHLQKYASQEIDQFREAVMDNTFSLFHQLPKGIIACKNSINPIRISQIEEKGQILLDLKFTNEEVRKAFFHAFKIYTRANRLACMPRASFSYIYTTYIQIKLSKDRITPGLEGTKVLQIYAAFFRIIQEIIEKVYQENPNLPLDQKEQLVAKEIQTKAEEWMAK